MPSASGDHFFPSKYLSQNAPHELHAVADYFIRKMKLIIFECCDAIEMWRISEQININHKMSRLFIQLLIWILEQFQFSADNLHCKPIGYSKKSKLFHLVDGTKVNKHFWKQSEGKIIENYDWSGLRKTENDFQGSERVARAQKEPRGSKIETDRVLK